MDILYIVIGTLISVVAFVYLPHIVARFWISQHPSLLDYKLVIGPDGDIDKARRLLIERVLYASGATIGTMIAVILSPLTFWLLFHL